jgi:hypothetical protein
MTKSMHNAFSMAVYEAKQTAERAVNGEGSALEAFVEIKDIIKQLEEVLDELTPVAVSERSKYGKERIFRHGYEVEMAEGRTTYDYKHYDGWKKASESLKGIEEIMKNGAQTGTEALDANGELIPPATMKFGKPYLKLTFKGGN